jgi:hypothetical protein
MCWSERRYRDLEERQEYSAPEPVRAEARASDTDRQRVIDQLRVHTADGRLTLDEFETRVGEAWVASTHGELQAVLRELPAIVEERPPQRRRHRSRGFGVGVPAPLMIAALVVLGSMLLGGFAWWLIPIGFFAFGGCGAHRERYDEEPRAKRDDALISA